MKYISVIYILFILSFIASCNNSRKVVIDKKASDKTSYKEIAFYKYENDTLFTFSIEKSYILCQKAISKNNLNPNILNDFFVFDISNNKIIYEDKLSGAKINWYSDFELRITLQKGIQISQADNGTYTYIYNLKDKTKKTATNNLLQN